MTTSNSADYSVSGGDIVNAAYRIVYNTSSEYTLEAFELADGLQALNLLVKNLMGPPNFLAKGMKRWQRLTASLTLAVKMDYDLKSSGGDLAIKTPVKILAVNYKDTSTGIETPMVPMTIDEQFSIANKAATGIPTRYAYERQLDTGKFRLDVIPSAAIVAAVDTLTIAYLVPLEDFDSSANTPYFPQEWYRPLKWLLAQEWSPEAGKKLPKEVAALAAQSLEAASAMDPEDSDMYFEPDNPNMQ